MYKTRARARRFLVSCTVIIVTAGFCGFSFAQPAAPEKPKPDAIFGNWLYQTPDPRVWTRSEQGGDLFFWASAPPGDYCTLTLFAGAAAGIFSSNSLPTPLPADQRAKGTVKIEADSGVKQRRKAQEGYDVLNRTLRSETSALHTFHIYGLP